MTIEPRECIAKVYENSREKREEKTAAHESSCVNRNRDIAPLCTTISPPAFKVTGNLMHFTNPNSDPAKSMRVLGGCDTHTCVSACGNSHVPVGCESEISRSSLSEPTA